MESHQKRKRSEGKVQDEIQGIRSDEQGEQLQPNNQRQFAQSDSLLTNGITEGSRSVEWKTFHMRLTRSLDLTIGANVFNAELGNLTALLCTYIPVLIPTYLLLSRYV